MVKVADRFATDYVVPVTDASNDATDVSGAYEGGVTKVTFRRKWRTGDKAGDVDVVPGSPVSLIFAHHGSKDVDAEHVYATSVRGGALNLFSDGDIVLEADPSASRRKLFR